MLKFSGKNIARNLSNLGRKVAIFYDRAFFEKIQREKKCVKHIFAFPRAILALFLCLKCLNRSILDIKSIADLSKGKIARIDRVSRGSKLPLCYTPQISRTPSNLHQTDPG